MEVAPKTTAGSTGEDSSVVGGSVPQGVGIFKVDFWIVVTVFTGVPETAVVAVVAVVVLVALELEQDSSVSGA